MTRAGWIGLLTALWALLFAAGFLHVEFIPVSGKGWERLGNALLIFLGWQVAALIVGLLTAGLLFGWWGGLPGWARVAGLMPALGAVAAIASLVWLVAQP